MAYWGRDQRLRLATPQWCEWFGVPATGIVATHSAAVTETILMPSRSMSVPVRTDAEAGSVGSMDWMSDMPPRLSS